MLPTIIMLLVLVLSFVAMLWLINFAEFVIERPRREAAPHGEAKHGHDSRLAATLR